MTSLALLLLFAPTVDEAVRTNGTRLEGELRLSKTGQLAFTPTKETAPGDIVEYRRAANPPPFRVAGGMMLTLDNDQRLSGVVVGMKEDHLLFRTVWAERLSVPRDRIVSLAHLPGWRPAAFVAKGDVQQESSAIELTKAGQSLIYSLNKPLDAGRIGVNLHERDTPRGARWLVEATFGKRTLRVTVAGAGDAFTVDAGGLKGTTREVKRSAELRRLILDFSDGSLRLTIDDEGLFYTLDAGPGAPLTTVRLACSNLDKPAKISGRVSFSQFALERAVDEPRHPPGDVRQDELWLAEGDQLFGHATAIDARGVELNGKFGVRRFAWAELRGWYPRQGKEPPVLKDGVRVGIRGGLRAAEDVLAGTLLALDAREVRLRHAVLGEVTLPRDRVAWLRPLGK